MTIRLKDIDGTLGGIHKIQKHLFNTVPIDLFFTQDRTIIAFHCLKHFNFKINSFQLSNKESIEKACLKVLEKCGIFDKGEIVDIFKTTQPKTKPEEFNPIFQFVKYVVGFNKLPVDLYYELEDKVKSNLKELLNLINKYESDETIIEYNKTEKNRAGHLGKTKIDFYKRCLKERDTIIKYLTFELKKRVIIKAKQDDFLPAGFSWLWYEEYWDRPYKWWQYRSIEFFDYERINVCRHRLLEIYLKEIPDYEQLYAQNKAKFYKLLNNKVGPEKIFHYINHHLKDIPILSERIPIFIELKLLLKSRKWFGFTALALSQIEGIFTDMLYIMYPKEKYSSLSTKVSSVRPHYKNEERNFDYFEYYLPLLRNSFLHAGSIQNRDFKLLSFDLLYDLNYILGVVEELNDPYIELHNILKRGHIDAITGIESFNHLFTLLSKVKDRYDKNNDRPELKDELDKWVSFEMDMQNNAEIDFYISNLNSDIDERIKNLLQGIYIADLECNLHNMPTKDLKSNFEKIKEIINRIGFNLKEDFDYILSVEKFIQSYRAYLPNCSEDVNNVIADIKKRNVESFKKIHILKPAFQDFDFYE